eukprot:TRINITY_DN13106_c0_g1_i1.p1 TRINITY_DN13106_c0_g1~~TRINITY_DN13106_c0_g1_i1.p1  ORF type:complete len:251 (+),score=120.34 TRINITY_DN13106_c0_g1_i1:54-755(+)
MPKSRRPKLQALTNTSKKGKASKEQLIDNLKEAVNNYERVFVFSTENLRNKSLKKIRQEWASSRFFFGKNKVMALALGKSEEDEHSPNIHLVSERLTGNCGLLFTDSSAEEVEAYFSAFSKSSYARSGSESSQLVTLPEGDLLQFPSNMYQTLHDLHLPVRLNRGVIQLIRDYTVCKVGDTLTVEQCRILQLLKLKTSKFRVQLNCYHDIKSGEFHDLDQIGQKGPAADGAFQ